LYIVITPGGKVSRSTIDIFGRVASSRSVVVCGASARSISFPIDPVLRLAAVVAEAIVADDEWFMDIFDNGVCCVDNDDLSLYLPQSSSSEPSAHSGFPLQYVAHFLLSSLQDFVPSGQVTPNGGKKASSKRKA
jgi:hypothetical protein